MRRPSAAALLTAFALLAAASDASAYCRATTCRDIDDCGGTLPSECKPLKWRRKCVGFAIQEDASVEVSYAFTRDTLKAAFAAWEFADCGGAGPGILVEYLGKVACDRVEFNATAGNVNVLVYRDKTWPHEDGTHNLALTTVTFDPDSGELYNADIEVNTAGYDFSDGGDYDYLSVLTHEAGHFLGLSHSGIEEATMYFSYTPGSTDFRTLEPDDIAGICAIYPPRVIDPAECNPIPRHGFATECAGTQVVGCGVGGGAPPRAPLAAAAALAAAWLARRLRARSAGPARPSRRSARARRSGR